MNLAELQAEVITLTNRPDLTAETLLAVRAATLKLHQSDYYYKDIFETGIVFPSSEYEQDFEVRTFIPRFRAIKYARVYNNADSEPLQFFEVISPENVLDTYKLARTDVCYLGGEEIHFKCKDQFQHMLFGCYINPDIVAASYDTNLGWIARDHPYAIVYEATANVFRQVGQVDKARSYQDMSNVEIRLIMQNNIKTTGE